MMEELKLWWAGRARREQILLAFMLALLLGVVLWMGVWRPSQSGLRAAALANADAVERHGDILRKTRWLKQGGDRKAAPNATQGAIEPIITQSAAEAGFTPDRVQAQGAERVEITIASARSTALLGWIVALEQQGVVVEKAMITPSGANGTVSAGLTFRQLAATGGGAGGASSGASGEGGAQ